MTGLPVEKKPTSSQATTAAPTISPESEVSPKLITIDPTTDDDAIKSIPIEDTWLTYHSNCDSPSYDEESWNKLADADKYDELLNLKLPVFLDITSQLTTFVVTADTADSSINDYPKKDCKLLLTAYANNQGFPHFVSRLDDMTVEEMRMELISAKKKLSSRPKTSIDSNTKKLKHIDAVFVLTHDTTDADIESTCEHIITTELKTMFKDRGLYESVEWESLTPDDIRNMARIERDEMLK